MGRYAIEVTRPIGSLRSAVDRHPSLPNQPSAARSRLPEHTDAGYLAALPEFMHGHRKKVLYFLERLEAFTSARGVPPGAVRILEVGCSHGRNVTLPVAEVGYAVTGIDIHAPSVEAANTHNRLPNARFVCQPIEALDLTEMFDVIILSDVLEHVDDPAGLLKSSLSRLREGGMVLVCIPNGYGPYEIEERLTPTALRPVVWLIANVVRAGVFVRRRRRGLPWPPPELEKPAYNFESGHVQRFTPRSFQRLLHDVGLSVVSRRNGSWFGGDLSYYAFYFIPKLTEVTLRVADHLPARLVSTWYFDCRRFRAAVSSTSQANDG